MKSIMGYSSARLFVFVCIAIMAVTPASTAQEMRLRRPFRQITLNVTGVLLCGNSTGPPPVANATVRFICRPLHGSLGAFNTTPDGTINVSIPIKVPLFFANPLRSLAARLKRFCYLRALSQICPGSFPVNPTTPFLGAPINATAISGNPNTINITTNPGIFLPLPAAI
nr:hypothetical protein Iba_chr09dCG9710 [Ipomoea batatas]